MTSPLTDQVETIIAESGVPWSVDGCGVTRRDTQIVSLVHRDAYLDDSGRHRALLVGGLSGKSDDVEAAASVLQAYASSQRLRNRVALSAIPCANPDGRPGRSRKEPGVGSGNGSGGDPSDPFGGYPPEGGYFNHETDPEARYLWRYIGFMAPDYVVEVRAGDGVAWECAGVPSALADALDAQAMPRDSSLLSALSQGTPNDLGQVPGIRLTAPVSEAAAELGKLWRALDDMGAPRVSQARSELASRRSRSPLDVAAALVERYGDTLDPVIYTQGVSISGRLRYGELTGEATKYAQGVAELVEPYTSGSKFWFAESDGGANHAGLVWCDEMFEITGDERYRDLLVETAELYRGPVADNWAGVPPPPCDPDYRTEDFFFSGALMGRAYALTGDASYLDIQVEFLLNAEIQQDDGLFMHCRSVPHYWGRGNGFAALGYAETLTRLPESHPARGTLIEMHTRHLDALRGLQRPSGMLSQLLDFPGTYQELTAVCMTGYAVARGLRMGWLPDHPDKSYRDFVESLWRAASERIGMDGSVVDGCTGTGAVDDRRFYIDRAAEYGQDDRTGNLALWFAVEMERLRRATL